MNGDYSSTGVRSVSDDNVGARDVPSTDNGDGCTSSQQPQKRQATVTEAVTEEELKQWKRSRNRENNKKYRKKKLYEDQIKKHEGELGVYQKPVEAWLGNKATGSFQKVTQMTKMAEVRNKVELTPFSDGYGRGMMDPNWFRGAIVAYGDPAEKNYDAIPEGHFRCNIPVLAPHGEQWTAKQIHGQRWTGVCHTIREGGSNGWIYVKWETGKDFTWVASHRVDDRTAL